MKKVCLVGCGAIARTHAKNLKDRVELSFYSRSPASATRFQRDFGGGPPHGDFDALLADPQIDGLVISSPPQFHCEQVVAALQAGKKVLVEKPMCLSSEEMERIGAVLEERPGHPLVVAENYYYKPSLEAICELIRAGAIGRLESATVRKQFTQQATGWKEGYGALLEGGIHFVALISAIFEATGHFSPTRVTAQFPDHRPGEAERHSRTRIEYGEATAHLAYAWNQPSPTKGIFQHSRILGDQGRITFESNGIYVRLSGKQRRLLFPGFADMMGYGRMTDDFVRCLEREDYRPLSDFTRARRDLQIVFSAYANLRPPTTEERP